MIQSVIANPFVDASHKPCRWDVDHGTYHSDAPLSISHSESEVFRDDPSKYERRYVSRSLERESTKALDIGTVFHDVALGLPYECDRTNYRQHTICHWERMTHAPETEPHGVSDSGSRYWYTTDGVIRESDHWGRVHSCYWELDGMASESEHGIGFARWSRFLYDTKQFTPVPRDVLNGDGHRKGSDWKDWISQHGSNRPLKAVEADCGWSIVPQMVEAIRQHEAANTLLYQKPGDNELSIKARHEPTGLLLRCRIDAYRPGVAIGDLKSIREGHCHPREFSNDAYSLGYHRQAAWYQDLVFALTGDRLPFVFIVVDKVSFRVETFEVDDKFIEIGRRENNITLSRMAECFRTGRFVSPTHGRVLTVSAPRWASFETEWEIE